MNKSKRRFRIFTKKTGKYFRYHNYRATRLLLGLLAAIVLFAVLATVYTILMPLKTNEVIVRVKQGDSTKTISRKLSSAKVIRSAFWFDVLARLTKSDRHLKAGRYVFGGNISLMQTIIKIREGRSTLIHLTIPEGFSLHNVVRTMEKSGLGSYDSLMTMATDPALVKRLTGYEWNTLEGCLYPETYAFDIDLPTEQVFGLMTGEFYKRLTAENILISDENQFYQNLILASMVEQEAVKAEEKPLIAGVFLNRLKKNMRLESCPTVEYTLERQGVAKKQLSYQDLEINTPYNTYKISGLPPNPICNPSVSSLQAVLFPEATEYLYFFADFEGQNIFSKTYAEHLNKQRIFDRQTPTRPE